MREFQDKLIQAEAKEAREKAEAEKQRKEEEKKNQLLENKISEIEEMLRHYAGNDEEIDDLLSQTKESFQQLTSKKQQKRMLDRLGELEQLFQQEREKRIALAANWTLESAIEFYEKVHKNSENAVSESIMWENYRRDLWDEVENDGQRILLHWTNISHAVGSYDEFIKEGTTTRIIHYSGDATYPDDPSIYYIVDNETHKVLNEDEADRFVLNEATALIAFNLFEGYDKHASALYEVAWKYTGENNTQVYVSSAVGGAWEMSVFNNYLVVERTASTGEILEKLNIPLDQLN